LIDLSVFSCPVCHEHEFSHDGEQLVCTHCNRDYPVFQDIPVLVANPHEHVAFIRAEQERNPDWYKTEQPSEEASPWRHHVKKRRAYVEHAIQTYLSELKLEKADKVLDLGCGDGNNIQWLEPYADQLYGSDYNLDRLTRARVKKPDVHFFLADILNYPALDDMFGMVFFNHVIEHIPDDETALKTVYRILKPGGLLVLGAPNEGSWWWQLAYKRAPEIRATTDHVHFYTARTLCDKVLNAGLKVFEVKHLGWGPPDFRLDGIWRQHKLVDDLFEIFGKVLIPHQASSLYLLGTKST